ncbi:MAG: class II aldolase/adducin family protein [Candidatus Methanomethylicaceae archaeon]
MENDMAGEYSDNLKTTDDEDVRRELCLFAARLKQRGLTSATGGNISYRVGDDMWISPTGCVLDELEIDDWVKVNLLTGEAYPHKLKPSSEIVLHREVFLTRPDVLSIMHSHPPHVIALSLLGIEIQPLGSEAPMTLGDRIPLIPYEIPTSPMLGKIVAQYARDYNVMVLENHGLVVLGKSNREAYNRTELTEEIAKIMTIAYSLGKSEPHFPSQEQIKEYKDWYYHKKLPHRLQSPP